MKFKYFLGKFRDRTSEIFNRERLKKYGMRKAIFDFIVFLCHRSNSKLQLWAERKEDLIVQKYLYDNYNHVIERYKR